MRENAPPSVTIASDSATNAASTVPFLRVQHRRLDVLAEHERGL